MSRVTVARAVAWSLAKAFGWFAFMLFFFSLFMDVETAALVLVCITTTFNSAALTIRNTVTTTRTEAIAKGDLMRFVSESRTTHDVRRRPRG